MRFELKNTEGLSFMTLNNGANFELGLWFQEWHEELDDFRLEHSKVLKIIHWWALFVQRICFSQKITEELCIMTQKGDAKCKRKLICGLKKDIRNLVNFHANSRKSENLHFDRILLPKAYADLDEKVQKSWCKVWRKTDSWFQKWRGI